MTRQILPFILSKFFVIIEMTGRVNSRLKLCPLSDTALHDLLFQKFISSKAV